MQFHFLYTSFHTQKVKIDQPAWNTQHSGATGGCQQDLFQAWNWASRRKWRGSQRWVHGMKKYRVLELHSVLGWRNPLLHMVSAGLRTTSTWTCPEFKHKAKFPYKKVQVLQKMAQFCQLHLPHRCSTHQVLCSVSQIINSGAWQIWPSPRLSLVGIGAGCCSFEAGSLDMAVGCMCKGQ